MSLQTFARKLSQRDNLNGVLRGVTVLCTFHLSPETIHTLIQKASKVLDKQVLDKHMPEADIKSGRFICEHVTHFFCGKGSFPTGRFVKKGTSVTIRIDALVRRRSDHAMAYRCTTITDAVTGEHITVKSNKPHITAFCPDGVAPKESLDYVYDDSEEVEIIPFDETVEATCQWKIFF